MKQLFIARHGDYDSISGLLTSHGKKQINSLADTIKNITRQNSIYLISSTAPRALDSSEILKEKFGLSDYEKESYIWTGTDSPKSSFFWNMDFNKLIEIIKSRADKTEALVVLSHLEVCKYLPAEMHWKLYNKPILDSYKNKEISKGCAGYFDIERKRYVMLFPDGTQL